MANEPTQSTLCDLQMPHGAYFAAVIAYANNYIWKIEDSSAVRDAEIWKMMSVSAEEYIQSFKIGGGGIPYPQEKS